MVTIRVERAVRSIFGPVKASEAQALLDQIVSADTAMGLPVEAVERIWAAMLKQSDGSIETLEAAAQLARRDWRDLLMAAGFGYDPDEHDRWLDSIPPSPDSAC